MTWFDHLSFARLTDLVEGRLPPDEAAQAQSHLSTCSRCQQEYRGIGNLVTLMRTDEGEDAPEQVVASAVRLFRRRARSVEATPSLLERLVATLTFDSGQQPLALGVRAGRPPARQRLYRAAPYQVDVRVAEASGGWVVSGQVLGPAATGRVELVGERGALQARLNPLSEFSLPATGPGTYTLTLTLADGVVVIPDLEIGG